MKSQLDLLGATGAVVSCVYARHNSWTGLSNSSMPPGYQYAEYSQTDGFLGVWLGNGFNRYEGCCAFEGKWWKGGTGKSESSAYDVLMAMTSPNLDGENNNHQCYNAEQATAVSYPAGTP